MSEPSYQAFKAMPCVEHGPLGAFLAKMHAFVRSDGYCRDLKEFEQVEVIFSLCGEILRERPGCESLQTGEHTWDGLGFDKYVRRVLDLYAGIPAKKHHEFVTFACEVLRGEVVITAASLGTEYKKVLAQQAKAIFEDSDSCEFAPFTLQEFSGMGSFRKLVKEHVHYQKAPLKQKSSALAQFFGQTEEVCFQEITYWSLDAQTKALLPFLVYRHIFYDYEFAMMHKNEKGRMEDFVDDMLSLTPVHAFEKNALEFLYFLRKRDHLLLKGAVKSEFAARVVNMLFTSRERLEVFGFSGSFYDTPSLSAKYQIYKELPESVKKKSLLGRLLCATECAFFAESAYWRLSLLARARALFVLYSFGLQQFTFSERGKNFASWQHIFSGVLNQIFLEGLRKDASEFECFSYHVLNEFLKRSQSCVGRGFIDSTLGTRVLQNTVAHLKLGFLQTRKALRHRPLYERECCSTAQRLVCCRSAGGHGCGCARCFGVFS